MKITYPIEWDDRDQFERPAKGWLNDVVVTLENGAVHTLSFYDPVRLAQELESEVNSGKAGIIEKGLLVVPEVTKENIEKVIYQAFEEHYFE